MEWIVHTTRSTYDLSVGNGSLLKCKVNDRNNKSKDKRWIVRNHVQMCNIKDEIVVSTKIRVRIDDRRFLKLVKNDDKGRQAMWSAVNNEGQRKGSNKDGPCCAFRQACK